MAPFSQLLREQIYTTLFLLKDTGFVINNKKSLLYSTKEIVIRISWDDYKCGRDEHESLWRQDQEHQAGSSETAQPSQTLSLPSVSTDWQAQCNQPSPFDGLPVLSLSLDLSEMSLTGRLSVTCFTFSSGNREPSMVGTPSIQMEWQELDHTANPHDHNFRCFPSRMGSSLQWNSDQRSLVSTRTNAPHQLLGASGDHTSSTDFCQGKVKRHDHLEDRQHHCSCLYQQDVGDNIT